MATCKDCVHFEACKNIYEIHGDGLSEESYGCDQFSNRARFVELPFPMSKGSKLYYVFEDKYGKIKTGTKYISNFSNKR